MMKIDMGGIGYIDTDRNQIIYKTDFLFRMQTQYGLGFPETIHRHVISWLKEKYEQD